MSRLRSRYYLSVLAAVTIAGTSSATFGQSQEPTPLELAQALFDKASAEMDQGRYAPACQKLEEATRLAPDKLGVKETLAECYEKTGKLASAWYLYRVVIKRAMGQGQIERAKVVRRLADALKPRLSTLMLTVPEEVRETPGLVITRNGTPVIESEWGTAIVMDGGDCEIVVAAPAYQPFRKTIAIARERADARLRIERLEAVIPPSSPLARPRTARPTGRVPGASPLTPPSHPQSSKGLAGMTVAVAGAGGIVAGVVLASIPKGRQSSSEIQTLGNASAGFFAAGFLVAMGGIVVIATAPPKAAGGSTKVALQLETAGAGVLLRGAW